MKKILRILMLPVLLHASGCAELTQTARIMNTAFIELFRLPIYILRMPFAILQNMGPVIQSAVRSAANVAPLLLFIENRTPPRRLDPAHPGEIEEEVMTALSSPDAAPLLPLLARETDGGPARRFILLDARIAADPRGRAAVFDALGAGGGGMRVVRVDGSGIFTERERFLALARRMGARGDILVSAAAVNDALAAVAGSYAPVLPDDPGDRAFVLRLNRALRELESHVCREG